MNNKQNKNCVIYCRISSAKGAQEGEGLDTQERICRDCAERKDYTIVPHGKVFRETFSGRKDTRPVLEEIFDYIENNPGKVQYFVFRMIDRFTRGGGLSYEGIKKKLAGYGVEMIDTTGIIQPSKNTLDYMGFEYDWSRTSPSGISELVMADNAKTEVTTILTRMIGQEIALTQKGFKVRGSIDGYLNKRVYVDSKKRMIQVPDPERAKYFIEMFKLRALGMLDDKQIVDRINAMGYRSRIQNKWDRAHERIIGHGGGQKLTVKRLQTTIKRPIYCGIMCEKWTRWLPIKAQYEGLVTIDTFNQANRGSVFIKSEASGMSILYDYYPERLVVKRMRDNPLFPYKSFVLCPTCNKPFLGSCPVGKGGQGFPTYHCSRKHKYFGVPKKDFEDNFKKLINSLQFKPETLNSMEASFLNKFHERKGEIIQSSIDVHRNITDLKIEQKAKSDAFVATTSSVLRANLEKDIEELEERIKSANGESKKIDITEDDITSFKTYGKYFMEHLPELLLNTDNPRQQQSLLSLVFESFPTYTELVNGTPKLAWVFKLSLSNISLESLQVTLRGVEPRLQP